MSAKVLWLDLETTGTDPLRHGIIQLAALVEVDLEVVEEIDLRMRPLAKHSIESGALAVSGTDESTIKSYPHQSEQFTAFQSFLDRYINRYEKLDKFVLSGYNINSFDEPFLRQLFLDNAATREERKYGGYFGSYFFWPKRDVQTYLAEHISECNLRLSDYKLETACAHFGIAIKAHDALSDIHATRQLYRVLRYSLSTAAPLAA